jgi:DNA-binding NtrC family response regulator
MANSRVANDRPAVRVLLIEDDPADAALISNVLSMSKIIFEVAHADTVASALQHLRYEQFDVILSDIRLPDSLGIETLFKVREYADEIPIIVLSGLDSEELAITAVREGAQDYLVKGSFNEDLLVRSILYSIERNKLMIHLENSLREIRTLKGLIPICAWCRKLRDDDGYWKLVETYIMEHTDAAFTHGICPECAAKAKAEFQDAKRRVGGNRQEDK